MHFTYYANRMKTKANEASEKFLNLIGVRRNKFKFDTPSTYIYNASFSRFIQVP